MNPAVLINVLCHSERDGWIAPFLMNRVLEAIGDGHRQQRHVVVGLTCDVRPVDIARNNAVAEFLKSPCHWLVMIDNDTVPAFRILDLIKAADEQCKAIVAAPTPMFSPKYGGLAWNCSASNQDDFYRSALPKGWFRPFLIGAGFLAVRRTVYEKMTPPWFVAPYEDFAFCVKAQDTGFKLSAHSDFVCSHLHTQDLLSLMR